MKLDLYQIDAFANKIFEGNPAAVIPLDQWLSKEVMQSIAQENNLSETELNNWMLILQLPLIMRVLKIPCSLSSFREY